MKKVGQAAFRNSTDGMRFLIVGVDDQTNRSYYLNTGRERTRAVLERFTDDLLNGRADRIGKNNVDVKMFLDKKG